MKVLHVSETLPGGLASYLSEILPRQAKLFGAENVILLAPQSHIAHLETHIDCHLETYGRRGRDLRSLIALACAIQSAVRRHRPQLLHLHSSFAGAVGRLATIGLHPRPEVIYCAHCWSFDRTPPTYASRLWCVVERLLSPLCDLIINVSPHEETLLIGAGFKPDRVALVVSGIADLAQRPSAAARLPAAAAPLRLLFVGRVDAQKGFDLLLREIAAISPSRASLTVVGGPVRSRQRLMVPRHVKLLGWVPRERISSLIEQADAVIMPSRWEGMPLLALEVLRAGRVLVASNRGPFPHIISHGTTGILIDIDKPGFLQDAIAALEQSDLAKIGNRARTEYEERFSAERMNWEIINLYGRLLGVTAEPGALWPSSSLVPGLSRDA
jgi:glycosyltransferase involved in cell wall biosynthesis